MPRIFSDFGGLIFAGGLLAMMILPRSNDDSSSSDAWWWWQRRWLALSDGSDSGGGGRPCSALETLWLSLIPVRCRKAISQGVWRLRLVNRGIYKEAPLYFREARPCSALGTLWLIHIPSQGCSQYFTGHNRCWVLIIRQSQGCSQVFSYFLF